MESDLSLSGTISAYFDLHLQVLRGSAPLAEISRL